MVEYIHWSDTRYVFGISKYIHISYKWKNKPFKMQFSHSGSCTAQVRKSTQITSKVSKYFLARNRYVQITKCVSAISRMRKNAKFLRSSEYPLRVNIHPSNINFSLVCPFKEGTYRQKYNSVILFAVCWHQYICISIKNLKKYDWTALGNYYFLLLRIRL